MVLPALGMVRPVLALPHRFHAHGASRRCRYDDHSERVPERIPEGVLVCLVFQGLQEGWYPRVRRTDGERHPCLGANLLVNQAKKYLVLNYLYSESERSERVCPRVT